MAPDAHDYLLPGRVTLEDAGELLGSRLELRKGTTRSTERRYYETFDGLLRAAGLEASYEDGRLSLTDAGSGSGSGEVLAAVELAEPPERLLAYELPPGPLREQLKRVVDVRALLPLVHLESEVRELGVVNDEDKLVVRLALERPAVITSSGRRIALRPRVRLFGVRGYDEEQAAVRAALDDDLGLARAERTVLDEAVLGAGGVLGGVSSKIDVELSAGERSDVAAAAVLGRLLEVIEANLPGTLADVDAEFLHDFRVAVRRSRAVQREFKGVFPSAPLAFHRGELRWLQQVTGPSRDLDVYVLDFDEFRESVPEQFRGDLDPLLAVLRGRRLAARREMVRELRSDRAREAITSWGSFLQRLQSLPEEGRPDAVRPIASVAGERISKVYRGMVRMGRAIDASTPPEAYHELRKKGKELRYLLELFGLPLFASEVVKPMVRSLKSLQDVLGRHQDREVQVATLRSLADEVSALPGGAAALMAMGLLVDRLLIDERAARGEFAATFHEFASGGQRKLVKETFR
jgi:CHAD domain-containing protein